MRHVLWLALLWAGSASGQWRGAERELQLMHLAEGHSGDSEHLQLSPVDILDQTLASEECGRPLRQRAALHKAALYAAECAYHADSKKICVPENFKLAETVRDKTGLVVSVYISRRGPPAQIFAVQGTRFFRAPDWRTWKAAFTLGLSLLAGTKTPGLVAKIQAAARDGKVVLTGHSQGGTASQILGYLSARSLKPGSQALEVVTWGSPGGHEKILEALAIKKLEPRVLARMESFHYRFPADPFAKIGTRLGHDIRLPVSCMATPGEPIYAATLGFGNPLGLGTWLEAHTMAAFRRASRKGCLCQELDKTVRATASTFQKVSILLESLGF